MGSLIILLAILAVLGLGLGYYAPSIFKGKRPHGVNGDIIAGLVTAVGIGLLDWYIIPMILPNMGRLLVFISSIIEPLIGVLIVLWLMRYLKNR